MKSPLPSSFQHALRGMRDVWLFETNARIHSLAALVVIVLGVWWHISRFEWIAVWLCIGGVFALEAMNTALENMCDALHPAQHPLIKRAKDAAAAAVLCAALAAVIVALFIFLPLLFSV